MRPFFVPCLLAVTFATSGCVDDIIGLSVPDAPTGLWYQLEPSGDPAAPSGMVLRWDEVDHPDLDAYRVYSRGSVSQSWGLRGTTTSTSFHDAGVPHLQYYVTAVNLDGDESEPSDYVEIDERLRLPSPATLVSISLDGAIHLDWTDNAAVDGFDYYRLYSASYNIDTNVCGSDWVLEGTTISPAFLVSGIGNGRPRCFAVSAISVEGYESLWSPLRYDTPRPDGHNVILFTSAGDATRSGFRFFRDLNNDGLVARTELGLVGNATTGTNDLVLTTDGGGNLMLSRQRATTDFRTFGTGLIGALTDIDIAPELGYGTAPILAEAMRGYVFRMDEGDLFYRYGSLRVSAVGPDYVIFDWGYQTDPGNPELLRVIP
jgi:hypothetical protein